MLNLPLYSQNDPRWKLKRLGNGTGTIGMYGCTLTCISMIAGYYGWTYLPDMLNDALKAVDAFTGSTKNLINWPVVPKVLKMLHYDGSVNVFDNDMVKKYLELGQPIIVRVDAAPIGAPKSDHFVVAIGDGKIHDPWDGQIKSFSTYEPTGYRLLLGTPGGQAMPTNPDEIAIPKKTFEELVSKATKFDAIKAAGVESEADVKALKQREIDAKNGEDSAKIDAKNSRESIARIAKALNSTQDEARILAAINEEMSAKDTALKQAKESMEKLEEAQKQEILLQAEVTKLTIIIQNNKLLSGATMAELFEEFFRRVKEIVKK